MLRSPKVSPAARKRWELRSHRQVCGLSGGQELWGFLRLAGQDLSHHPQPGSRAGCGGRAAPSPVHQAPLQGQGWAKAGLGCQPVGQDQDQTCLTLSPSSQTPRRGEDALTALTVSCSLYYFSWVLNFSANISSKDFFLKEFAKYRTSEENLSVRFAKEKMRNL